jgi:hypothetical protein
VIPDKLGKISDVPIGTCVTAVDLADTQRTIIAVFHEGLYFGDTLKDSLLNPNQCRAHGLAVDTCPKQYSNGKSMHGIYVPENDLILPFKLHGCISYFASRLPTDDELRDCEHVVFTSAAPWDPYSQTFAAEERAYQSLAEKVTIGEVYDRHGDQVHQVSHTSSTNRRSKVDPVTLARLWGTSVSTASSTLNLSTTRAVRFYPQMGKLSRRFRTRQGQLRYPHLRTKWYTDTMFPVDGMKSLRGHTCAQLFCNDQYTNTEIGDEGLR